MIDLRSDRLEPSARVCARCGRIGGRRTVWRWREGVGWLGPVCYRRMEKAADVPNP